MKFLVTGAAGFIGFHTSKRLLEEGHQVAGLDNLNEYYDPNLKLARLEVLKNFSEFSFHRQDLADAKALCELVSAFQPERVIHLGAQAGVRYSIENPSAYVQSNLVGFANILETCRQHEIPHLVYASSSSVYGANTKQPFSEKHGTNHPLSMYAASKKSNELMAHSYSNLFALPTTGLRFFTAYGPWGRPDMALFLFTKAILANEPIKLFNFGNHQRDFTYIDDVVEGVLRVAKSIQRPDKSFNTDAPDPDHSSAPYRVYNIGRGRTVELMDFVRAIEKNLGKAAIIENLPLQAGDVPKTWADCSALEKDYAYRPDTTVEEGIANFVEWYREYYQA
jgi:UDP-glucuronate 4-epimerase